MRSLNTTAAFFGANTRCWLAVLAMAIHACGGRVSVGDLGTPKDMSAGGTTSNLGSQTTTASNGAAEASSDAGGGGINGSYYFGFDAGVTEDVSQLDAAACGVTYPATGFYGDNILLPRYRQVTAGGPTEMAAKLGPNAVIRIKMTLISGSVWWIGGQHEDWLSTPFNFSTGVQIFQAQDPGRTVEDSFQFPGNGRALVEYFECGSETPTATKLLLWGNGISDSGVP